jgi:uncharacterized protein (DUF433 family)
MGECLHGFRILTIAERLYRPKVQFRAALTRWRGEPTIGAGCKSASASLLMAKLKFDVTRRFTDPREMPIYGIPQAAHYLRVPATTLRYWVLGKRYTTDKGRRRLAPPVINLPDAKRPLLSFFNLAEAHILRALRKEQKIQLPHIRWAIDFVAEKIGDLHPLVHDRFKTDGVRLFVEALEQKVVDASGFGQMVMPELMGHLERLEFENKTVSRLYPFTRRSGAGPRSVFIDARFSYGRPVLAKVCVPTDVIVDRYEAGESVDDLARDYGCETLEIEEAIRSELPAKAA